VREMRIVLDIQGCQTESRYRGIGRYSMSFAKAVARNRGTHKIFIAMNGLFADGIERIRGELSGLIPQDQLVVWNSPGPVMERCAENQHRREAAERAREEFLSHMSPDIIHITSLFEGFIDDAVTSVKVFDLDTPVSVTLYDLIPLQNPDHFFKPNRAYEAFYRRKLSQLQSAELLLAISEFSARDACAQLALSPEKVVPVLTAIEESFKQLEMTEQEKAQVSALCGIVKPFILYTGGCDDHKNLPALIAAFAQLQQHIKARYQLVFAGRMPESNIESLKHCGLSAGLAPDDLVFTGYVSDRHLQVLYNICDLFVYPSWQEGFGMPPLEAMACGAPVIASGSTSLAEVIGWDLATFDPFNLTEMSAKIEYALTDLQFRTALRNHGERQARRFSWDLTAQKAIQAWEQLVYKTL